MATWTSRSAFDAPPSQESMPLLAIMKLINQLLLLDCFDAAKNSQKSTHVPTMSLFGICENSEQGNRWNLMRKLTAVHAYVLLAERERGPVDHQKPFVQNKTFCRGQFDTLLNAFGDGEEFLRWGWRFQDRINGPLGSGPPNMVRC